MPPAEPAPDTANTPDTADTDDTADTEIVDDAHRLVLRRIVVGPLATNCWAVHAVGSRTALLIDPGAEPDRLLDAVADLQIAAIVLTHAHFDHVLAVPEVAQATGAPVLAHPDDEPVWPHELHTLAATGHFDAGTATETLLDDGCTLQPPPGRPLWDGQADQHVDDGRTLHIGALTIRVLHTPGHTPGSISLAVPGHLLTGDTLFPGGPGLTGWPLSNFDQIMLSVRRLLHQPDSTLVHPGHGPDTTLGRERPSVELWRQRGW